MGEGSIVFNIGLLRRLENDDQIAFVLCHELAHLTENHVNQSIADNLDKWDKMLNSKEYTALKKQKYGRYEVVQNLLKDFTFDHKRHSRTHEAEADKKGMTYLLNTSFDPKEAIKCLEILDLIDQEKYASKLDLKKIFDFPDYPFKDRWLRSKKSSLSAMKKDIPEWDIDSLKTHPDCSKRISLLNQQIL